MFVLYNDLASTLLLVVTVPLAIVVASVSWLLARHRSKHAELRVWIGIAATLPELTMLSLGWLELQLPMVMLVVTCIMIVGAVQCARAELRYLRNGPRETRWRLAPHGLVPVSVAVFIAAQSFEALFVTIWGAVLCGLVSVWGTWPMRPIERLKPY